LEGLLEIVGLKMMAEGVIAGGTEFQIVGAAV